MLGLGFQSNGPLMTVIYILCYPRLLVDAASILSYHQCHFISLSPAVGYPFINRCPNVSRLHYLKIRVWRVQLPSEVSSWPSAWPLPCFPILSCCLACPTSWLTAILHCDPKLTQITDFLGPRHALVEGKLISSSGAVYFTIRGALVYWATLPDV